MGRNTRTRRAIMATAVAGFAFLATAGIAMMTGGGIDPRAAGYRSQGRLWIRDATTGPVRSSPTPGRDLRSLRRVGRFRVVEGLPNPGGGASSIMLTKTAGTDPNVCAATDSVAVPLGSDVTYCFEAMNDGGVTLSLHDLVDDQIGSILSSFPFDLNPGATVFVTASQTVTTDVVNTAEWTAFNPDNVDLTSDTDTATVTVIGPSILLTKTVGTDPNVCAVTDMVTVPMGTDVTYCYDVENTGPVTLALHDLVDDQLGTILSGFPFDLTPGASVFVTQSQVINDNVTNMATWTASLDGGPSAQSTDSATVMVEPIPVELQEFRIE